MSSRIRQLRVTIPGIIVSIAVVLFLLGLMYDLTYSIAKREGIAETNARYISEQTREAIKLNCTTPTLPVLTDCITAKIEGAEKSIRDGEGLRAQQDSADYAFWMLWISALGATAGTIGVVAVWQTLNHTAAAADAAREQVKEARISGQDRVRAVLKCTGGTLIATAELIRIRLTIKNVGLSDAGSCELTCKAIIPTLNPYRLSKSPRRETFPIKMGEEKTVDIYYQKHNPDFDIDHAVYVDVSSAGANLYVELKWADVFGGKHAESFFACSQNHKREAAPGHYQITTDLGIRSDDPISLEQYVDPRPRHRKAATLPY